jgi:hypothetical protein
VERLAFYRRVVRTLTNARAPFLIGGALALAHHTGIRRVTKDLDLMVRRSDWPLIARVLRQAGIHVRMTYPHWLGKALSGGALVDIIFSGGSGQTPVDDVWFERSSAMRLFGTTVRVAAAEELLWSKAFVMERERFDGADVQHLIRACGRQIDWHHLCARFRGHERVLLSHVALFGYIYPSDAQKVPRWVMPYLLSQPVGVPIPRAKLCRGPLLSRAQYLVDVQGGGYRDARLPPFGTMTQRERHIWTKAIPPTPGGLMATRSLRGPAATRESLRAPGKRHRRPPPSLRGAKHSNEMVAKDKSVRERRRWARD